MANKYKMDNKARIIDNQKYQNLSRRCVPTSNFIEQILTKDYLKSYKYYKEMISREEEKQADPLIFQ